MDAALMQPLLVLSTANKLHMVLAALCASQVLQQDIGALRPRLHHAS
jgi:hypothetical protein